MRDESIPTNIKEEHKNKKLEKLLVKYKKKKDYERKQRKKYGKKWKKKCELRYRELEESNNKE